NCTGTRMSGLRAGCPVEIASANDLPDGLLLRARLRIRVAGHDAAFQVVAQKMSEELIVVGITPYGTRLFELRQRDRRYTVEPEAPEELRIVASYALDALYRAYWIEPPGEATSWDRNGERVSESRSEGGGSREYRQTGWGTGFGSVTIVYDDAAGFPGARGAKVENPWCGYRATIILLGVSEEEQAS
ncbi:MAG: DUF3261 domain-containing protein, partial [Myxococcales bacterium]